MYLEVFILIFQLCCLTFCCYCMKMHSKTFLAHFVRCKCINILLWYCIIIISGIGVIIRILTSSTFELNWKTSIEHPFLVVLLYWITFCRPKGRKQESEKTKKVLIQSIATIRSKKMIEFSFSLCVLFKEFSSVTNREKNTTTQKLAKFKFISIIICIHSIAVSGFFLDRNQISCTYQSDHKRWTSSTEKNFVRFWQQYFLDCAMCRTVSKRVTKLFFLRMFSCREPQVYQNDLSRLWD